MPLHYGQHADAYFENHQLKSQLLRSDPLFIEKKSHGVVKYSKQFRQDNLRLVSKESKTICKQRSKTKSSVTSLKKKSLHKKLSSENIAKRVCHYSTYQNTKFHNDRINEQFMSQNDAIINGAKNINRRSSFIASIEKHPRSYAEMITDYSESLYKDSTVGTRSDNFHFSNAICKSPFSTFSVSSSAKKIVNVAEYSELSTVIQKNDFPLPIKSFDLCRYNDINTTECYNFQHYSTCTAESMNKNINQNCVTTNDLKSDDQSYAKLVADCSKSMHNIPNINVLNDGLVPKRTVLARNSLKSVTTPRRASGTYTQETLRRITPNISTIPFEKNNKGQMADLKENNWLREMENVMSDLKSVTERKIARVVNVPKLKESDILQSMDASNNSLDNIHRLTELIKSNKQKEKDATIKKLNYQPEKINRMERRKKDLQLQKHNYSHSSDKIANRLENVGNAAENSVIRKNSTHVSTSSNTGISKQPQVKLRMVPSEKESVVSINVDQVSIRSLDPLNSTSEYLSVVVQSDQKEDLQLTDNQSNTPTIRHITKSALQRNDFGPMRISISEDSAPVKQIEFSINGKPVSELKSITARTERLDVVSSVDKIEIRIPFVKDDSNALDKTRESDLSTGITSNIGQILNVQISANFQNEPTKDNSVKKPTKTIQYQHEKDTIPKSSPTSPYLFNNSPKAHEKTLSSNIQQYESSKRMNIKFNDTEKNINEHNKISDVDFKIQRKATNNLSAGKTITDISLIEKANNVEVGSLNIRKANITGFPEANKYNKSESSDSRFPSKIIPWWSSSDSFNKMKKKEDDYKPLMPLSNRNEQKAVSNLNQNLISESLLTKPKETSNSKILTKKTPSMNNATVPTSDSSNIISYSNSMKSYEESKPTLHYACSFRLKPNQENSGIIPEIVRNGLKAEDNQMLTAKKDSNKISEIKQTESIILSTSDTINMRGKHDTSVKDKTSVLQKKIKTSSSAQNLSPKRNQEKKNNSLKQTKSIDDVSKSIKSKIKDILDAIKPIDKREDTLVDYNLKKEISSRKSIIKLNSAVKEVSSPIIRTKDLIPNSSTAEIASKKIDKTMLMKKTESINTEKLKMKIDILKNKDLTIKNDATTDIKALNKNDVKNIKEVCKNDFMSSSSSNFRNSSALMQTLKKQEQLAGDTIVFQDKTKQNLKSLVEANKNEASSSLNIRTSSGTMQKSEKLGISGKVPSEVSKQNRSKNLTSIKNTPETIQESEKSIKKKSIYPNLSKESSNTIMIDKSPLQTIKQMQSKSFKNTNTDKITNINKLSSSQTISNSSSKIKDTVSKNLLNKNAREISIAQSVKNNKTDTGDIIARIVTQNPKSKDPLLKKCEENYFNKSVSSKGYLLGSAGPSRKQNNSVGFKSAGSKTKSRVISNNNYTYEKKLLMKSFYSNFNRKNDIISSSQSTISKVSRNVNDVDMLKSESTVIRSDGPWINIDRPEKSILYSAWLQRFENDVKKNGKLF